MACTSNFTRIANSSISFYNDLVNATELMKPAYRNVTINLAPGKNNTVSNSVNKNTPANSTTVKNITEALEGAKHPNYNKTRIVLNDAAKDFGNILGSVDPIVHGCYSSAFEFKDIILDYVSTFKDWQNLLLGLVHKVGDMYDVISFIIKNIKSY